MTSFALERSVSTARRAALVAAILTTPTAGCSDDASNADDTDTSSTSTGGSLASLAVTPASLDMNLFEIADLTLSGVAPFDGESPIVISWESAGLRFFNASPGMFNPGSSTITGFRDPGDETFSVTIRVECEGAASETVEIRFLDASVDVPITCAPGHNPTSTTSMTSGDPTSADDTGTGDDTGGPANVDLICRQSFEETLRVITLEGPDAGVELVEPGLFITTWAREGLGGGPVIGATFARDRPSGFVRWDSAADIVAGEPAVIIEDDTASGHAESCATPEGGLFVGFGLDSKFCDFETGTCMSLGLDEPMPDCECAGMECIGDDGGAGGFLFSDDGGRTFTPLMAIVAPSSMRSNSQGVFAFYDGATTSVLHSQAYVGPYDMPVIPPGGESARPVLVGESVAFLSNQSLGRPILLRSDDDAQTWEAVDPPGASVLGNMVQLTNEQILAADQETLWLSTDGSATDWVQRDDLGPDILPSLCLPVGG